MKTYKLKYIVLMLFTVTTMSCEDFLDKEPPSYAIPEDYYQTEDQVQAATNSFYVDILPSHDLYGYGIFDNDNNTDNQAGFSAATKYAVGQWKVGNDNGSWYWNTIRNLNYTINTVLGHYTNNEISGQESNIRHYIGELYFFRAYSYFNMLRNWGDLPIVTEALPDNEYILIAANKRFPRNEVARFIIASLDSATYYMMDKFDDRHNRISPDVANLFKSRVALYEGTWLTYFKNTPFVPNGEGWPGKAKDYNANYQYPSGNIDEEIKYFLNIAVESADIVAAKYCNLLTKNSTIVPQSESDVNPYFYMFGAADMSGYSDILLWREYNEGLTICNSVENCVNWGNNGVGLTRSMVEAFVMADGKPIYASHNGYTYRDDDIKNIRENTDPRLRLFLKEPGQKNLFKNMNWNGASQGQTIEAKPNIMDRSSERGYSTGYAIRKGGTFDKALTGLAKSYNGAIVFRATEALLNYMEAQYMLTKNLHSGNLIKYWKAIRSAAGFTGDAIDPQTTISATQIENEKSDWGAYSAGKLLEDVVLYNIRRERRCELMAEGLRWMDLTRWRSLDQMINEKYHIEGFRLWNTPMEKWYDPKDLVADGSSSATVSSPTLSEYYRPYERNMGATNLYKDGFTWRMAHYLQPLPIKQFLLTASDHISIDKSPLYQNPYWPTTADLPAEQ